MAAEMITVRSTNIRAIGWDSVSSTLYVKFTSNAHYAYAPVSEATFKAFLKASSKGQYFAKNIRDKYQTHRL